MATDHSIILNYLLETGPADITILDIGSKTGKWLDPFVSSFKDGTFYCFEPLPEQFEKLIHRYRNFSNVIAFNSALSDKEENTVFYRDIDRKGWSGLKKHQYIENFDEIPLQTKILDNYNLNPYFIKIDVEGAELLVLQGGRKTLQNTKVIFFECNEVHFQEYSYTAENLYNFLTIENFQIVDLEFNKINLDKFIFLTADKRRYEIPKGYQSNFIALKDYE